MMRVLLFDIDGTLIHTAGAGGAALREAFCDEFQVPEAGDVPFSGRTDRAIGRSFFQLHGLDDSEENWKRLRNGYLKRLPGYMRARKGRVLDGVTELLEALAPRDDVLLGLLTGNILEGARIKLGHFGLFDYFPFGGFGDQFHDRNDVARAAMEAAAERLDGRAPADQVWVIGDTPLDVSCARAINARVLAVETGIHPREELVAAKPDVLLADLSNTARVLERLLG